MYVLQELATAPTVPWANGAGVTTELVSFDASRELSPGGADPWRLSVARLDRPAPFSPLPGVRRTFMPLDGALTLVVAGRAHELEPGMPLQFSGDAEVELERLPAPCRALNLMVRGSRPGRIIGVDGSGRVPDGAPVALAILDGAAEAVLVVTPGITSLTPEPHRVIDDEATRFFLIPN